MAGGRGRKKIKPTEILPGVIIGYVPAKGGISSLLVAAQREGELRYIGEVSVGLTAQDRTDLARQLPKWVCPAPVVPCPKQAVWLESELYCRVRGVGWTPGGRLRGASFAGLIEQ